MSSSSGGQSAKLVIIGVFLAAVLGVLVFALTRGKGERQATPGAPGAAGAAGEAAGDQVVVDFLYSTEKQGWIEETVIEFEKANPGIDVRLEGKGSFDAVRAILDGEDKPTLWSPADTVAANLLAADWFQKERKHLFPDAGDQAPQPLVLTPLVFVAWEDRGQVLTEQGSKPLTWQRLHAVLSSPEGWSAIGGPGDWGLIRLGHTDPTQSNSGMQALLLMAYEHHGKSQGLEIADVLDRDFQAFVKGIEDGVPKFGKSTGTFMTDMILYGPSKYDVIVAYENLAIEQLPNAQGRWGNLRIYYPQQSIWSSHPAVLLDAPWVSAAQKQAGRKLIAFMRSPAAQQRALRYGFRPADPGVPLLSEQADNPFHSTTAYGVRVDIPSAVEPPPGPVIRNLIEMWSRQIGR